MGLRFTNLSSGSTGNATVVGNGETYVLVDAGLPAKRVVQLLEERELDAAVLQAILVTHEHSDHIKGIGALARKYNLPVYANEKTWKQLDKHIGEIVAAKRCILPTGAQVEIGSMQIESFGISHDAVEPVGYCFRDGTEKLSLATDLGYMSQKVRDAIADSDVLVLESNHDVGMLRMGRYPWHIKQRILSDIGHLSNEAAGEALCDILSGRTKRVYLAHLSRDHNMMDLARMTVANILRDHGITIKERVFQLMDTYYDRPTKWDVLAED
ncbi:MBL fold metallo-hydrolase [Paenibacillus cymbidii]|uniref:MBL fold metallo-hydrolase n=1 Tax=Paenibacillus cymbidii TaxID=1639034 RepID=UPI001081B00A|nr:MBL fold metallo-hydrolase [Paenibacillus cymbidii]